MRKRNLLFDVADKTKRDVLSVKELNDKLKNKQEGRSSVRKVSGANGEKGGVPLNKIRQTVQVLVNEFKKKHPELPEHWPSQYVIVDTEERLDDLCETLRKCKRFAYDTETTGLHIWLGDTIVGMSYYTPIDKRSWYVPLHHVATVESVEGKQLEQSIVTERLQPVLAEKIKPSHKYIRQVYDSLDDVWWVKDNEEPTGCVTFNGKFDSHVMWINLGIEMPDIVFEGYLAMRVLNENEPVNRLKVLANKWLKKYKDNPVDGFDEIFDKTSCQYFPIWLVAYYACKDAELTWEWMEYTEMNIRKRPGLSETYYCIQLPTLPPTIAAERRGITIDVDMCKELELEFNGYLEEIEHTAKVQLQKIMDDFLDENPKLQAIRLPSTAKNKPDTILPRATLQGPFIQSMNVNSTHQLAQLFYDIWGWEYGKKEGKSTGEKVMTRLARKHAACRTILDIRTLKKQLGTYVIGLQKSISPIDGRVHTSFNIFGARTGRFSSSDPNLQNIPAQPKKLIIRGKETKIDFGKKIRRIFKADSNHKLCSTDYSQIEPRILAVLCKDPMMLESYRLGKDIYSRMAQVFFPGHPEHEYFDDDITGFKSPWRKDTKAIVLGLIYGMTEVGLANALGCTEQEAVMERQRFFDTFPEISQFLEGVLEQLRLEEFVETIYHTKCRIPKINDPRHWIKSHAERQGPNSIIQGSSADITKRAMQLIEYNERLQELCVFILLTVHDEVITSIPDEVLEEAVPLVRDLMIDAAKRLSQLGGIQIKVDAEVSERWYGDNIKWTHEELDSEDNDVHLEEEIEYQEFEEEEFEESVFS